MLAFNGTALSWSSKRPFFLGSRPLKSDTCPLLKMGRGARIYPPLSGGLDLNSSNSGCARLGSGVAPPLGVVEKKVAVLIVLDVRRHRRVVCAAVRRAVDDEVPGAVEEEAGPAAVFSFCKPPPRPSQAKPSTHSGGPGEGNPRAQEAPATSSGVAARPAATNRQSAAIDCIAQSALGIGYLWKKISSETEHRF